MSLRITVATTKGGSGKSTIAILLAGAFANQGLSVSVLDTDPQHSLVKWQNRCEARNLTSSKIKVSEIENSDQLIAGLNNDKFDVTITDVQGAANFTTLPIATANSDIVIIPCVASEFDASEVQFIPKFLKSTAGRQDPTPYMVVLNNVDGIEVKTNNFKEIVGQLYVSGLQMASTIIFKRVKYREIAAGVGSLYLLQGKDDGLLKAIANIEDFADEILTFLAKR